MRWLVLLIVPATSAVAVFIPASNWTVLSEPRPPLVFSRHAALPGEVPSQPTVSAVFPFENRSARPLEIRKTTPSCGCLRTAVQLETGDALSEPVQPAVTIEPGQSGRVIVQLDTVQETPGSHSYTIDVLTTDGDAERTQTLTYRMELPQRKVTVSPVPLLFYQANAEKLEQKLTVFDARDTPLLVTGVESDSEYITSDIKTLPDGHTTEITVQIEGELPRGQSTTNVLILTDADGYREIRVPTVLAGLSLGESPSPLVPSDVGTSTNEKTPPQD